MSLIAKSASEWDVSELVAYDIEIRDLTAIDFFGVQQLPPVSIQGDFVNVERWEDMQDLTDSSLGFQMSLAMGLGDAESAVDLFAIKLLDRLGYTSLVRQIVLHQNLRLRICGETRHAKSDVSLVTVTRGGSGGGTILLVQEDKRMSRPDPVAQLMAEAIAAAEVNNWTRKTRGLQPLPVQVMPAISLIGMMPTFYRVPVSLDLIDAIARGRIPKEPTIVERHTPVGNLGMVYMADRLLALRCYKEFYKYIDNIDRVLSEA